ncbi:MAG: PD40 domain-containing protein [Phycisphaeraceae bacterium]|nr:PD40 domain-containing protein [Phycisphaeraceae bacterium]
MVPIAVVAAACSCGIAQDWRSLEAPLLTNHVQLTDASRFLKAGEAYFNPDSTWIIFQAIPRPPEGEEADPHYSMYVAHLVRNDAGEVTGLDSITRVSHPGSANTCGWFVPRWPGVVMFGSTNDGQVEDTRSGFQVKDRKYLWQFPRSMDVSVAFVPKMLGSEGAAESRPLFSRDGYDAECSSTTDGRFILYAHVDPNKNPEKPDADIFVYDVRRNQHVPLVVADGYDGGPFFSPDGQSICYRSDRQGNDLLQLFVAELRMVDGRPTGIISEHAITDDGYVNWAPFFHPSGKFLVYASSGKYHSYDVFAIELDPENGYATPPETRRKRRITFAEGFDGLPAFNSDGSLMMWTSQRTLGDDRAESQLWLARVNPGAAVTDWTDPLSSEQAIDLARLSIGAPDPGSASMTATAQRVDAHWLVTLSSADPAEPPIQCTVDDEGNVERLTSGT